MPHLPLSEFNFRMVLADVNITAGTCGNHTDCVFRQTTIMTNGATTFDSLSINCPSKNTNGKSLSDPDGQTA
jgi:hypothetical protein